MAKGSYFQQHQARNGEAFNPSAKEITRVSDDVRAIFEGGKVLLIDKDVHWTSFDAVRKIRNALRIKKVGHAGTLDPLATGLLIICTGKFTKEINSFMAQEKEYTGTFTLGATTPTYDLESEPENVKDVSSLNDDEIKKATLNFTGNIKQFPPVYSAIKQNGTRLYELARRGEEVELKSREVTIHEFEITSIELPLVHFRIVCSTGTYIRSIANDFGAALGCGAYLSALRRTRIGDKYVSDAITVDRFLSSLKETEDQKG